VAQWNALGLQRKAVEKTATEQEHATTKNQGGTVECIRVNPKTVGETALGQEHATAKNQRGTMERIRVTEKTR